MSRKHPPSWLAALGRFAALTALALLALQLWFLLRVALLALWLPSSTTVQRSEVWRLATAGEGMHWRQQPVAGDAIADNLRRAVIASEDAGFVDHSGVEWEAIEKAWQRNQTAQARAAKANASAQARIERAEKAGRAPPTVRMRTPKVVGGSTITQQLAKNLFLSGERTVLRKGQELIVTQMLELLLPKARILDVYLNSVEWGEGVFGAEAAAQRYYQRSAARLSTTQAARLAVMLPSPKRFEKNPGSAYIAGRGATIAARMRAVELP